MDAQDYTINRVISRNVPIFTTGGKSVQVTRVSIFVGDHGPFVKDFGPGTGLPDTADAINTWKSQKQTEVMSYSR